MLVTIVKKATNYQKQDVVYWRAWGMDVHIFSEQKRVYLPNMYVSPMVTDLLGAGVFRLEEYFEFSFFLQYRNYYSRNLWPERLRETQKELRGIKKIHYPISLSGMLSMDSLGMRWEFTHISYPSLLSPFLKGVVLLPPICCSVFRILIKKEIDIEQDYMHRFWLIGYKMYSQMQSKIKYNILINGIFSNWSIWF